MKRRNGESRRGTKVESGGLLVVTEEALNNGSI